MKATTAAEGRRTFLTVFCFFFQHLFEKEEEESAETLYKTLPHETAQKKNSLKTGGDPIWDCTSRRSPLPGILLFYYSKYMQLASLLGEKVSRIFSHKKRNSKFIKKQKRYTIFNKGQIIHKKKKQKKNK